MSFGSRWRGYWQSSRAPAPDRLGDLLFPFPRPARGAFPAPPPRKKTCRIRASRVCRRLPDTMRKRAAMLVAPGQAQTRESQRAGFSQPLEGRKGEVSEGLASAGAVDDREGATSAAGARLVALHVANFFLDCGRRPRHSAARYPCMSHTPVPWVARHIIVHACATRQGPECFTSADTPRDRRFCDFHEAQKFCLQTWVELSPRWKVATYVFFGWELLIPDHGRPGGRWSR